MLTSRPTSERSVSPAPDLEAARRLLRSWRRVGWVEFDGSSCIAHGTRHRLPCSRRVPCSTGLGLVALGVRAVGVRRAA